MSYSVSAPGSLMLLGEYAVLHGHRAIAAAIDKRITITLTPRNDNLITIQSDLGEYKAPITNIKITKPFEYVLTAVKNYKLKCGCDIKIESDFSHTIGFGSSAAVTVATIAVINLWLNKKIKALVLVKQARDVIQKVQKRGSGTDVAASVFGGIVAYKMAPLTVKKFKLQQPITVLYSGYKTPTAQALRRIKQKYIKQKKLYDKIFAAIGQCVLDAMSALQKKDWQRFGSLMDIQQALMQALDVNTSDLQVLIDELRLQEGMLGAKISGSGLGDCVIGLGVAMKAHSQMIPCEISLEGVRCEKI